MVATTACPVLFSNDGGSHFCNTRATHLACQTRLDQLRSARRAPLWLWEPSGAAGSGAGQEKPTCSAQDNGAIGTRTAASTPPTWNQRMLQFLAQRRPAQPGGYSLGARRMVRLFRRRRRDERAACCCRWPASRPGGIVVQLRQVDRLGRGQCFMWC